MKQITTIVVALLVLSGTARATTYTLSNGNFGSQTSAITFTSGDVIEIPSSTNVSFTTTQTISTDVDLNIHGTLMMTPGTKILTLAAGSEANIYPGGTLAGNDANQRLIIGTLNVFTGSDDITATDSVLTATESYGFLSGGSPLPVSLLSFDAAAKSGSMITLNWTAINDGTSSVFTVEQSTDGYSWMDVASVNATGARHETIAYALELQAPTGAKALVYRLRYVGSEGRIAYSASRSLSVGSSKQDVTAAINTSGTDIRLSLNGLVADGSTHIYVTTTDGRVVYNQAYTSATTISIPTYVPGLYIVTVTDHASFRIAQKVAL
jgi:hypothetical protein